ncbi:YHS domain-containing protein, partial [Mesorhizobium sp. LNHC252B00]|uniref:YHS domain-containing protein n=2 Tax=Phyllobacteriaceae TaxID=69277 RepID=UPI0012EC0F6B
MTHSDHDHHTHGAHGGGCCAAKGTGGGSDAVLRDPVCGMAVEPAAGKPTSEHGGRLYHFCSERCRSKFKAEPGSHLIAVDPVCGMSVDRADARYFVRHEGQGFYFCSAGCKAKFEAAPQTYLGDGPAPAPMPKGTQYTCPMHPQIIRDKPGSCPICGMAL